MIASPQIAVGLIDHLPEDVQAMLIAKYSRDYSPIADRLPSLDPDMDKLRASLRSYYKNYGHKSIGQIGGTTTFIEEVSQIAAKAIEDHPLFNGQEPSTRYLDFASRPMVHFDDPEIKDIQEELRGLYIYALNNVKERVKKEYPFVYEGGDRDKELTRWQNTVQARAFDICRSILPAGVTTAVGFKATFDVHNDHFGALLMHPSPEVAHVAEMVLEKAWVAYPDAIKEVDELFKQNSYRTAWDFYHDPTVEQFVQIQPQFEEAIERYTTPEETTFTVVKREVLQEMFTKFRQLRKGQQLSPRLSSSLSIRIQGLLDFGSFRDLHRHRNGVNTMPLLTSLHGINEWYLKELPADVVSRLNAIMARLSGMFIEHMRNERTSEMVKLQYAVPMGANVPIDYVCGINQAKYMIELRTGKTSHQTLRIFMQRCYSRLVEFFRLEDVDHAYRGIYPDLSQDNFTLRRGEQTFTGELKFD